MNLIFNGRNRITQIFHLGHQALDIVGDDDKNVLASVDGRVVKVQIWDGTTKTPTSMQSYGNLVIVQGIDGRFYYYAHLKEIYVKFNQTVKIGDRIGYMGNTGNSYGAHTHFEVRKSDNKSRINPIGYLGIPNETGIYINEIEKEEIKYMAILNGIDVSKHQGKIDWEKVKKSGKVDFAILRAGYGMYDTQKDETFEYNYSECKRLGIPVGAYWYFYCSNVEQAKKEAETCLKIVKDKTFEYGIWADEEYEPNIKAATKQVRTDMCITFMEEIKKSGYKTGLYCSYDWVKNYVDESKLSGYDKWIAQYSSKCSYTKNDLAIWQYSSKGSIDGINGNVDVNYCYKDYTSNENGNAIGTWKKDSKGWWYEYSDKTYAKNQWKEIDGAWYWFDSSGYAVKGFQIVNGRKYYFAEKSAFGTIQECQLIMTNTDGVIL